MSDATIPGSSSGRKPPPEPSSIRTRASGHVLARGGEHLGVDLLVDPAQRRLGAEDLPLDLAGFLGSEVDPAGQGLGPPAAPHDE